ncbi:transglycosylase SLT domain-containing protein [Vibrio penaeicida]|uniref:Transglycosylase SLT domain-containing protein n=1 Tax=Vibrio penaeicida TaxID=104609 RepID=A0AAV5NKB2_9VIBR|nr:transglycosylase SLT domain-containing protein [Vibrio penaeicida]RTZ23009.1 hypothetical protein EKN09_11035 [Vibrio penaeicida]GLQ71061.1 hypothetical protein GCM10007932_04210 [Vibrio penaeicida]
MANVRLVHLTAMLCGLISFGALSSPSNAPIEDPKKQRMLSGLSSSDWIEMSQKTGIPIEVLYGLALRESGNYDRKTKSFTPTPNALAIGKDVKVGQKKHVGLFRLNDNEKVQKLESLIDDGHTNLGIGLFQISYRYNRWRADKPVDLYDPKINSEAAAGVLLDCKKRFKTLKGTLSCYRRGKVNDKGLLYSQQVMELSHKYGRKFASWVTGKPSRFSFTPSKRPVKKSTVAMNYRSLDKELSSLDLLKKHYQQYDSPVMKEKRTISIIKN